MINGEKLQKVINIFETKNIQFEQGLTTEEIKELESLYNIKFSSQWIEFYQRILPTSLGFYNWRDKSEHNINYIKRALKIPYDDILEYYEEIKWNDLWGAPPMDLNKKFNSIKGLLTKAPYLIPIYGHRYLPV